jgi:hypothetical protein
MATDTLTSASKQDSADKDGNKAGDEEQTWPSPFPGQGDIEETEAGEKEKEPEKAKSQGDIRCRRRVKDEVNETTRSQPKAEQPKPEAE